MLIYERQKDDFLRNVSFENYEKTKELLDKIEGVNSEFFIKKLPVNFSENEKKILQNTLKNANKNDSENIAIEKLRFLLDTFSDS